MYDITIEKSEIWNVRLKRLISKRGYSQESFAEALHKRYGTKFTQRVISRWTRVGDKTRTKMGSKLIGFPNFENMLLIADFFGVDVGYLVGETDDDTFSLEKACAFLGLSSDAAKTLIRISHPDEKQSMIMEDMRDALDTFLSADGFTDFVHSLNNLHQTYLSHRWMDTRKSKCLDYVIDFFRDLEYKGKLERYELNEALVLLINEMYPKPSPKNLPSEYGECDFCLTASHEEIHGDSGFVCPIK